MSAAETLQCLSTNFVPLPWNNNSFKSLRDSVYNRSLLAYYRKKRGNPP